MTHEIVPLDWCIKAMQRAVERVRSIGWNDVVGQYAAVSETLFWIDVVADQLRTKYARHYNAALNDQSFDAGSTLKGLRWARNRITHEVDEIHYLLATAKSVEGFAAEWTWQSLPPRPKGRDAEGHAAYQAAVAGRNVVNTLLAVTICLAQAASLVSMDSGKKHGRPG